MTKLTNPQIHSYDLTPVYDAHIHLFYPRPIKDSVEALKNIMRHFNYEKIHLAQVAMHDTTENVKGLYCKANMENVYTGGSLNHYFDHRDTADYFLEEIKKYHAMGCDSIKMLEGKGNYHSKLFTPKLDDRVYEKFFMYAEENEIPVLMHLGDPLDMWDLSKMSDYAIQHGWYCGGEGMPSREDLRDEVENILKKFPKLKLILAHFHFMSDDLERAAKMFDTYENLCFDLTPGGEMFVSFTSNYSQARAFFEKYSDRLLYGTDTYHFALDGMDEEQRYGTRINQVRTFLEKDIEFNEPILSDKPLHGLGLKKQYFDNIYRKNFERNFGTPRPLDYELIAAECRKITSERKLDDMMKQNMKVITEFFDKK